MRALTSTSFVQLIPRCLCGNAGAVQHAALPSAGSGNGWPLSAPAPSPAFQLLTQRWATKKAGGQAKQGKKGNPQNLGVKMWGTELVFPGMIIRKQRGTHFHPGYNVGIGKDDTIYAKTVGFVQYTRESTAVGWEHKMRRFVNVVPINGDWSPEYKKLEAQLVERRNFIKRQMVRSRGYEPALFFPFSNCADGQFSWMGPGNKFTWPGLGKVPALPEAPAATSLAGGGSSSSEASGVSNSVSRGGVQG